SSLRGLLAARCSPGPYSNTVPCGPAPPAAPEERARTPRLTRDVSWGGVLGRRRRHGVEHLANDALPPDVLHPELGPEREPVGQRGGADRLERGGQDEIPAGERGPAARELEERERAARAGADLDARTCPRGGDEVDDVEPNRLGDVDLLDRLLHRDQRLGVDDPLENELVLPAFQAPSEHCRLVLPLGIADRGSEDEPVE